jgi:histidinol-phosphate aminotransferase
LASDFKIDDTSVLLDLNENAYGPAIPDAVATTDPSIGPLQLHRYPDRLQNHLKQQLCNLRNTHTHTPNTLTPDNLFLGIGSVEAIDALIRAFCIADKDSIIICPPTYGMYAVSAQVNDVSVIKIPLLSAPTFALNLSAVLHTLSTVPNIKLLYITSPGNPTGSLISKPDILHILSHPTWNGVVVLDEAYIDFAGDESASLAGLVTEYPNLVVLHTLSKAFGLAGIRLGAAWAPAPIARLLNAFKAPWNIPGPCAALASQALGEDGVAVMRRNRERVATQRERLVRELPLIRGVGQVRSGTDSNFLMFEIFNEYREPDNTAAMMVYEKMVEVESVVVRFRGGEAGCEGCLRVTIGKEDEIDRFLDSLATILGDIWKEWSQKDAEEAEEEVVGRDSSVEISYSSSSSSLSLQAEEKKANGVVIH